jgi:hypothetical protein
MKGMKVIQKIPQYRDITSDPMSDEEKALRHPLENRIFAVSVAVNVLLVAAAVLLVIYGLESFADYPFVTRNSGKIRAAVIAILAAPIFVTFIRYTRHAVIRGSSVQLSDEQIPALYEILKRQADKLGLLQYPELYLSDHAISEASRSFSSWSQDYIVLGTGYLDPQIEDSLDIAAFLIGSELGRLRLGHTEWVTELALTYIDKIPYLRNPIRHIRIYSRDRYGAYLAPEGIRGLVIQASGRRQLKLVNINDYTEQVKQYGNPWTRLVLLQKSEPPVAWRIRKLLEAGFFCDDAARETNSRETSRDDKRLNSRHLKHHAGRMHRSSALNT